MVLENDAHLFAWVIVNSTSMCSTHRVHSMIVKEVVEEVAEANEHAVIAFR